MTRGTATELLRDQERKVDPDNGDTILSQDEVLGFIAKCERRLEGLEIPFINTNLGVVGRIEKLEQAGAVEVMDLDMCERLSQLELALLGDVELRKKWEAGKVTYPNIPEPPKGLIEMVNDLHDSVQKTLAAHGKQIEAQYTKLEQRLTFTHRLEAFFGPLLEGKNPPLDGNQVATKDFVDKSIATFAGAINARVSQAVDLAKALIIQLGFTNDDAPDEPLTPWDKISRRLRWAYERELERYKLERAAASRPSRLQSLVYAVTGRTHHNGAGR